VLLDVEEAVDELLLRADEGSETVVMSTSANR
jgi:hypothetical protein